MAPSELDEILFRHTTYGFIQPGGILALLCPVALWLRPNISSYLKQEI